MYLMFDRNIYGILMKNGTHILVMNNYLKSIAVIKMGYRMAATIYRKMLHESDCSRRFRAFVFRFCIIHITL